MVGRWDGDFAGRLFESTGSEPTRSSLVPLSANCHPDNARSGDNGRRFHCFLTLGPASRRGATRNCPLYLCRSTPHQGVQRTMLKLATKFRPDDTRAFETAAHAGIRGVEFWLNAQLLMEWRNIVMTARRFAFDYALHFPNRGELSDEHLESMVSLYRELQCNALVIHHPMFRRYADSLLALAPSLNLAVENHSLGKEEVVEWATQNPGLTLDVEHVWMYTLPDASLNELTTYLDRLLSRFGDKLRHVHLPGYRAGGNEHRPLHHNAEMVTSVLTLLADHGYSQLVVSEAEPEYQNAHDLRCDRSVFETWRTRYEVKRAKKSLPPKGEESRVEAQDVAAQRSQSSPAVPH